MYHNTISWMIAGGEPIASDEDRRMSRHLVEVRASREAAVDHVRPSLSGIVARFRGASTPQPSAALDCCAA